ncbi:hypothetical protein [Prosthecomicrobium pneumaticum]|uniref:Uncharacterized protein n=1 Tax=Prosthecomicrobium pneumaticum TaxID=81895 RepID=A0A7W9FQ90_9HYPH|nr:hypothetical protein [Prosthecomicrobium pneumaticum]MBB5754766.1 hypothetical protein [Prosthecomicrobium pneumaticum]
MAVGQLPSSGHEMTADDPRFAAALDLQIAQMRRLLELMAPASGVDALRSLRETLPEQRAQAFAR